MQKATTQTEKQNKMKEAFTEDEVSYVQNCFSFFFKIVLFMFSLHLST